MQDHLTTLLGPFLVNKPVTFNLARLILNPTLIWEYFSNSSGPLTTTVACDSLGFIHSDLVGSEKSPPDIQYHINSVAPYSDYGAYFHKIFGFEPHWWNWAYSKYYSEDASTILPIILHPKSRGKVYLQSSYPLDPPLIDPKYLSNPEDVQTLIQAIKIIIHLIGHLVINFSSS